MNCEEAAVSISALFDGEAVSREAAAHVSECEQCQYRLNEYARMAQELRRLAIAEAPRAPTAATWKAAARSHGVLSHWRKSMRIPRFAFAGMVIAILLLSGGLALVKARTSAVGPALSLTIKHPSSDNVMHCAIRTREIERQPAQCGFMTMVEGGTLRLSVRFVKREKDRVLLAIKTNFENGSTPTSFDGRVDAPEQQYWLEPDKVLGVPVTGTAPLEISGEFLDHVPAFGLLAQETFDAGPNEFRVFSPLLLKDNQLIANMTGALGRGEGSDAAVALYVPAEGRFVFSPIPFVGAIQGNLQANQITFELDGKAYLLTTAAPISRADHVWVLHEPQWRPSEQTSTSEDDKAAFLASGKLGNFLAKRNPL